MSVTPAPDRPAWHHDKRSRHDRGYGSAWDKLRLVILARDGYRCRCETCTASGLLTVATHVDHLVSKADWLRKHGTLQGCDAPTNLRAISAPCHKKKSLVERGFRPKTKYGLDGYPIDE